MQEEEKEREADSRTGTAAPPVIHEEIDYEYFRNLPIRDVIEVLGLEPEETKNGRKPMHWKSPLHEDRHPSLTICEDERGKRFNQWQDWPAGEGGSTIDLVIAAKYGIPPSRSRHSGVCVREKKEACRFLEKHFPGGIRTKESRQEGLSYPPVPKIPYSIIQECGLKKNPFYDNSVWDGAMSNRAEILLDAIQKREADLDKYVQGVLVNFPRLGPKTSEYIISVGQEWKERLAPYEEEVRAFYLEAMDVEEELARLDGSSFLGGLDEDRMERDVQKEMEYLKAHPDAHADHGRFCGYAQAETAAQEEEPDGR